ncbi:hypothetical protein Taro_006827 [Colocasia esculenta]|uniref:Uncharacterized protein n=1 Tax=Colocasia esculenta TaxID=4460 RepID=A0A843U1Z1_COLES|nr:hypothetical protein [Colocasia esculenta]
MEKQKMLSTNHEGLPIHSDREGAPPEGEEKRGTKEKGEGVADRGLKPSAPKTQWGDASR